MLCTDGLIVILLHIIRVAVRVVSPERPDPWQRSQVCRTPEASYNSRVLCHTSDFALACLNIVTRAVLHDVGDAHVAMHEA